jgi:hypothetical protein
MGVPAFYANTALKVPVVTAVLYNKRSRVPDSTASCVLADGDSGRAGHDREPGIDG